MHKLIGLLKLNAWQHQPSFKGREKSSEICLGMLDCHCHLADREFYEDIGEVVDRAKQVGVIGCLINTECIEEFDRTLKLSQQFEGFLFPCFGVHPVQYEGTPGNMEKRVAKLSDLNGFADWLSKHHEQLIALGETGLDHGPQFNSADLEGQMEVFVQQIKLANQYQLPIICHSRSAGKHVIEALVQNGAKHVLLHAFDGNFKSATGGISAGFYFSMPPSIIRSDQKRKLVEKLPLEQLILETDSPVLGPTKDERNEPKNITISAEVIAEIKKIPVDTVKRVTTENALRLFTKLKSRLP